MVQTTKIHSEWIEELFQNKDFTTKLNSFIKQSQSLSEQIDPQTIPPPSFNIVDQISQQITQLISEHLFNQIQLRTQAISSQIRKINNQISILKNYMFGSCEKPDLETTCYNNNRSKLQLSSILEQENTGVVEIGQLRSSFTEIQQRMNYWFGNYNHSQQKLLNHLQENSKLSAQINKKCNQIISNFETKVKQGFQSSNLLFQKRIQLISKTLNNVLEMINQNPLKDQVKDHVVDKSTIKQTVNTNNTNSLLRQNIKLKTFFSFGSKR